MKRLLLAFLAGLTLPVLCVLYLGGERLAVAGFRLAAIENGLKLAASEWHVDGVPVHQEPLAMVQVEPGPQKKARKR